MIPCGFLGEEVTGTVTNELADQTLRRGKRDGSAKRLTEARSMLAALDEARELVRADVAEAAAELERADPDHPLLRGGAEALAIALFPVLGLVELFMSSDQNRPWHNVPAALALLGAATASTLAHGRVAAGDILRRALEATKPGPAMAKQMPAPEPGKPLER